MARLLRADVGDIVYHVINRANGRLPLFRTETDYAKFEDLLKEAKKQVPMRLLAYCIMPNHWHFVLYPHNDGDLSLFMRWLTNTHTRRWHVEHYTIGYGHLYQGRYKSFPVQTDTYLIQLIRYVERNALRAKLVSRAEEWQWSSLYLREYGANEQKNLLSEWPVEVPEDYLNFINTSQTIAEVENIRHSINKNRPLGQDGWIEQVTKDMGLTQTLRNVGRPRKNGD